MLESRNLEGDIPVINLFSVQLSDKELSQLSFGLDHSYVDKNKYVKKNLAANFESLAQAVNSEILNEEKEDFHEFLRAYCDISPRMFTPLKTTLIQI